MIPALTGDPELLARLYQETRDRIVAMLTGPEDPAWQAAVAACPGWSVRDVVAHMSAVTQDWTTGRLTGAPTADQTATLVDLAHSAGLKAPLGDITSHEHDIRGAIGRPGARDSTAVHRSSDQLLANLATPVPLLVTVEDAEYRSGPSDGADLELRTSRFEALRWRTGRRSRDQLAAMDWSGDPAPVLEQLYLFGPAGADLID